MSLYLDCSTQPVERRQVGVDVTQGLYSAKPPRRSRYGWHTPCKHGPQQSAHYLFFLFLLS